MPQDHAATAVPFETAPSINFLNLIWAAGAILVMILAVVARDQWFLNFVHVFSAMLWTGVDLFMGFVVGPILRRLPPDARRAFIIRLAPRMLFLMPTLAIVGGTSGWFLAEQLGFFALPYPQLWWVIAAVVILVILTIQGIGILLPTNLRVYFELRKARPDGGRIARLMRLYIFIVASQGVMQVVMIVIMARFVTGI